VGAKSRPGSQVDYDGLAAAYDAHPDRQRVPVDDFLLQQLERFERSASEERPRPFAVLDLACGTGSSLQVQARALASRPRQRASTKIELHGLDPSASMLELAKAKNPGARFVQGRAEGLPYADASFDYLSCNFAFHHFEEQERALDEIARVLRPGGAFSLRNLLPEAMPGFWIYRRFPESVAIDRRRFWPLFKLELALCQRGFLVSSQESLETRWLPLAELLEIARARNVSELVLLEEQDYARGLARLEARLNSSLPEQRQEHREYDELALLTLHGLRLG